MFKKYDNSIFRDLREQHNIFVLVGNGFDISILKRFKSGKMGGKTTSYADFYEYISYYKFSNTNNILYRKMKEDRDDGKENWSDFENTIIELLESNNISTLEDSIDEFQSYFTIFLNDLVDADVLLKLNEEVKENRLSIQSLSEFLKDIRNLNKLNFIKSLNHYDLYNFIFVNFNYTSLLNNYIYLDKHQFDPHRYVEADRNFSLKFKLPGYSQTEYSSYVISDVIYPHGMQNIPRSILFGIDLKEYDIGRGLEKRLVKGYWSQYNSKYKSYIEQADLFIIYGMSLGLSDAWWMDQIFDSIVEREVELIIYMYGDYNEDYVKESFISCCIRHESSNEDEKVKVKNNIHVVTFNKNNTYFLGLEKLI